MTTTAKRSCAGIISDTNNRTRNRGDNGWGTRHVHAWIMPRDLESGIVQLIKGWAAYADAHALEFDSTLASDGYLGPYWRDMGQNIIGLLSGCLGRLDGGILDGIIRECWVAHGFTVDGDRA